MLITNQIRGQSGVFPWGNGNNSQSSLHTGLGIWVFPGIADNTYTNLLFHLMCKSIDIRIPHSYV